MAIRTGGQIGATARSEGELDPIWLILGGAGRTHGKRILPPMRSGIFLAPFGAFAEPQRVVDLAAAAEEAGWDGLFLWDHILAGASTPVADPLVTLAAVAAGTVRIRLGAMVTPLARRRPWVLARQLATLDRLSHGRMVLGVGLGDDGWHEFSAFGEDPRPATRAAALDDGLAVVRALLGGGPVSFQGSVHHVEAPAFLPAPLQQPLPVWAACRWPRQRPLLRAARLEGCFPIFDGGWPPPPPDPSEVRLLLERLHELGAGGEYDLAVTHASWAHPEPPAPVVRQLAAAGATWWLEWLGPEGITPEDAERVVRRGPPT